MSIDQSENTNAGESLFGLQKYLIRFITLLALVLILVPLLPGLISNLAYSFSGEAPKLYWYLSRSAGLVALTILWISMVLGLGITNKLARRWPGAPAAFAIHEFVSLLGLAFAVYHGLVLIGDHFVDFSLPRLIMPFSIDYERFWVGLGQVSFYVWALVTASFYVRRRIGQKTWRLIHYVNFATYTMGLFHGIFSGTDSSVSWVRWYYLASAAILLVLLVQRVHDSLKQKGFSLAEFVRQRVQNLAQSALALKDRTVPRLESLQQALLRRIESLSSSTGKRRPALTPQTAGEESLQDPAEEKTQPQALPTPAAARPSELPENPPAADFSAPILEGKESVVDLVVRFETIPSENKVRVRILNEPASKREVSETQENRKVKGGDGDTLVVRLKKDLHTTPPQPPVPAGKESKRIVILEE